MGTFHDRRYPGESDGYRSARETLLEAEINLRRQVETVAAQRRALPLGGKLKENYIFAEASVGRAGRMVPFTDLFEGGKTSLVAYSFMFGPEAEIPCPLCTSLLDGLNGGAPHIRQRTNLVVIAKTSPDKIRDYADGRGWRNLRLLSSADNSYNTDYLGEVGDGMQVPLVNVFTKHEHDIRHTYGTELLYGPDDEGQGARHIDQLWPLWNLLDLTPEGRGSGWLPKVAYE